MLINIHTLGKRVAKAIDELPILFVDELKKDNFKQLNIEQLLHGKNNKGWDMPHYLSDKYEKIKRDMNPNNRGLWDLRLTGEMHSNLSVVINERFVRFEHLQDDEKTDFIYTVEPKHMVWGIPDNLFNEVVNDDVKIINEKIKKIING